MEEYITNNRSKNFLSTEMIQNRFFSKDTIAGLNKNLQQETNTLNASREIKQEMINILVKNMKTIYKSIDLNKINNNNFDSIFAQYKKHSVIEAINDIKKNNILGSQSSPLASDLKFQRDFTSTPNTGNKMMERPKPTNLNQQVQIIEQKRNEQKKKNDPFNGYNPSDMNGYESNLDQAFRPIVENISDHDKFNNYDSNKLTDMTSRMDNIKKSRDIETAARNTRPPTPDFLKAQKSNPDRDNKQTTPMQTNKSDKPDFINASQSSFNQGFQGLANDSGGDLYSLDNIDKPLVENEIVEDSTSFEDRLKKLQSERGTMKPVQTSQQQIDFTSENFPKNENMGNNIIKQQVQRQPSQIREEIQEDQRQQIQKQQMQRQQMQEAQTQEDQMQRQKQQMQRQQMQEAQMQEDQNQKQQIRRQQMQEIQEDKFSQIRNSMKSVNIDFKEDTSKMKATIELLEKENIMLKEKIEKLDTIKQDISSEFENLRIKNEEIDSKLSYNNMKERELNKKESEVKQLIANYDYLFRSEQIQMEVTNKDNKSNYSWMMNTIPNVVGIKLMSYSLPMPIFNIIENKNNLLKLRVDAVDIDIIIESGKYTIEELLFDINNKLKVKQENCKLSINNMQKIIIENDNMFEIISTPLSKTNLGFNNTMTGSNKYISDKIWDLRIDDKVYLYLNNLSEEVPFGVLYFNGMSICQFKFEKPYTMNKLDIIFKDINNMEYDFNHLPHSLSFIIDTIRSS